MFMLSVQNLPPFVIDIAVISSLILYVHYFYLYISIERPITGMMAVHWTDRLSLRE